MCVKYLHFLKITLDVDSYRRSDDTIHLRVVNWLHLWNYFYLVRGSSLDIDKSPCTVYIRSRLLINSVGVKFLSKTIRPINFVFERRFGMQLIIYKRNDYEYLCSTLRGIRNDSTVHNPYRLRISSATIFINGRTQTLDLLLRRIILTKRWVPFYTNHTSLHLLRSMKQKELA